MNISIIFSIVVLIEFLIIFLEGFSLYRKVERDPALFFSKFYLKRNRLALTPLFLAIAFITISIFFIFMVLNGGVSMSMFSGQSKNIAPFVIPVILHVLIIFAYFFLVF